MTSVAHTRCFVLCVACDNGSISVSYVILRFSCFIAGGIHQQQRCCHPRAEIFSACVCVVFVPHAASVWFFALCKHWRIPISTVVSCCSMHRSSLICRVFCKRLQCGSHSRNIEGHRNSSTKRRCWTSVIARGRILCLDVTPSSVKTTLENGPVRCVQSLSHDFWNLNAFCRVLAAFECPPWSCFL